jgi:hypothetical protein
MAEPRYDYIPGANKVAGTPRPIRVADNALQERRMLARSNLLSRETRRPKA